MRFALLELLGMNASGWLSRLGTAAWTGGLALAGVWLAVVCFPRISPRFQCWLWRLAYLKLLLGLAWIAPLEIPVLPAQAEVGIVAKRAEMAHPTALDLPLPIGTPELQSVDQASHSSPSAAQTKPIMSAPASFPWEACLWASWLMGVGVMFLITLRQWRRAAAIVRCSHAADRQLIEHCTELAGELGVRMPAVRISSRVHSPLVVGVLRPALIYPVGTNEIYSAAEVSLMTRHELAHLKRRDLAWNWLPALARVVFFFHPLVWLSSRRWTDAQESACDEFLVQHASIKAGDFGRLLLKLNRTRNQTSSESQPAVGLAASAVLGTYKNLERRILVMSRIRTRSRRRAVLAAAMLSVIAVLVIAPWQLVAREPTAGALPEVQQPQDADAALLNEWYNEMSEEESIDAAAIRLQMLMLAVHCYAGDNDGRYPPCEVPQGDIQAQYRLSGLVLLLPYIGQTPDYFQADDKQEEFQKYFDRLGISQEDLRAQAQELYEKIDVTKGWNDPANAEAAKTIFPLFITPRGGQVRNDYGYGHSHFAFIRGWNGEDNGAFTPDGVYRHNISDGTSNTLAFGQVAWNQGPWIAAGNSTSRYVYAPDVRVKGPKFGSRYYPGMWLAAFADASLAGFRENDIPNLQFVVRRNDGHAIPPRFEAGFLPIAEYKEAAIKAREEYEARARGETPAGGDVQLLTDAHQALELSVEESCVIASDVAIPKVQVDKPEVVKTVPLSAKRFQVTGKQQGLARVKLFDDDGNVRELRVTVIDQRDAKSGN